MAVGVTLLPPALRGTPLTTSFTTPWWTFTTTTSLGHQSLTTSLTTSFCMSSMVQPLGSITAGARDIAAVPPAGYS